MTTFLIIVVLILAVVTIAQLVRVTELAGTLKPKTEILPTDSENRSQAWLMLALMVAYFGFFLWLVLEYKDKLLPEAASVHGDRLDWLLNFNFLIITIVFVVTHIFLFYFAFKYYSRKGRKAYYFAHSNKLELVWTIVPAIFLAVIVIYGLSAWNEIMDDAPEDAITIELYSKQFDWTARYTGKDDSLGLANYNLIYDVNPLGLMTSITIDTQDNRLAQEIEALEKKLTTWPADGKKAKEIKEEIARVKRHRNRVLALRDKGYGERLGHGADDVIVKGEFHIPIDTTVSFVFRSQDVIHSAYMPHFRAQMNTVPGMTTYFHFKTDITTEEMREKTGNPEFDYVLLCNKICGSAHYNMQMKIVVESREDYEAWLGKQKTFAQISGTEEATDLAMTDEQSR